jgi:hypothetical protein
VLVFEDLGDGALDSVAEDATGGGDRAAYGAQCGGNDSRSGSMSAAIAA